MKPEAKKDLRVGITGGIGSGKSMVCQIFESLGVPVYDADYWAKWLLNHDAPIKSKVKNIFGDAAYDQSGAYNRAYVAQIAFSDPEKLAALNAIVHPELEEHCRAWHDQKIREGHTYSLKEAALLIESGSYQFLDYLIVVTAPESLRIQRVMQRDGVSEEQVRARIKNQLPEAEKVALADSIIVNDGHHSLVRQVWNIHQILLAQSKK